MVTLHETDSPGFFCDETSTAEGCLQCDGAPGKHVDHSAGVQLGVLASAVRGVVRNGQQKVPLCLSRTCFVSVGSAQTSARSAQAARADVPEFVQLMAVRWQAQILERC